MSTLHWCYGLADCHGVESFVHDYHNEFTDMFIEDEGKSAEENKSQIFAMSIRAHANQQRHAVVYRVSLVREDMEYIEELISAGEYIRALREIKLRAKELMLSTFGSSKTAAEKNWRMIPNPDLDPYHNESEEDPNGSVKN